MKRQDREWVWVASLVAFDGLYDVFARRWGWFALVTSLFAIVTLIFPPPMLRRWLWSSP